MLIKYNKLLFFTVSIRCTAQGEKVGMYQALAQFNFNDYIHCNNISI